MNGYVLVNLKPFCRIKFDTLQIANHDIYYFFQWYFIGCVFIKGDRKSVV